MEEKFTILYVDDEEINLRIFQMSLGKRFEVIIANSGEEGIDILRENENIVAVISDMRMPGMNGVEFIKIAKEEFPEKYYYILSAFDLNEEIAEAINSNLILKYFRKPFNINEIEESVLESLN